MSNKRTNLILLAVLLGLLILVFFDPESESEQTTIHLSTLNVDQIKQLIIRTAEQTIMSLARENDSWQLLAGSGIIYPARDSQLQTLLGLSRAQSIRQYHAQAVTLEKLGLQPPAISIQVNNTLIELGNTDPLQQNRYALVDKSAVHLFTDRYTHVLHKPLEDWIDSALLPAESNITGINHPDFDLNFQNGLWQLQDKQGQSQTIDSQDTLLTLRDEWRHAQALKLRLVNEQQLADLEGKPIVRIALDKQDKPLSFTLISHEHGITLVRKDWALAYEFGKDAARRLQGPGPVHKPAKN